MTNKGANDSEQCGFAGWQDGWRNRREHELKVNFSDLHVMMDDSILEKFRCLIVKAGIGQIDFKVKFVAVKVHFGEVGNMAFLRQQYAKIICDYVKSRGGKPFLTDCNTLYVGYRNNALNHLDTAYMNGYNRLATGAHTIMTDGLRGTDGRAVPVEGGEYVKEAKIGAAIAEADIVISLTHFKNHVNAGFGGTMKNLGMGCGSKKGKMEMHSSGTPMIEEDQCIGGRMCVKNCANSGVYNAPKNIQSATVVQSEARALFNLYGLLRAVLLLSHGGWV